MVLNMLPSFSLRDHAYVLVNTPKLFCQFRSGIFSCFPKRADLKNIFFGELAKIAFFTHWMPVFKNLVFYVIRVRSNPKMVGANTRWVIAMMENIFPFRDFSKMNYPRSSVRITTTSISANNTIPCWNMSSFPQPTICCFIDKFPKANFQRFFSLFVSAWSASWPRLLYCFGSTVNTLPKMKTLSSAFFNVIRSIFLNMSHMATDIIAQKEYSYGRI